MDPRNRSNQEEINPKSELEQLQSELEQLQYSELDEQQDKTQYCMQQCKEKLCRCCKSCVKCINNQEGKKVRKLRTCYGAKQVCNACQYQFEDLVACHIPPKTCGTSAACINWTPKMGYAGCENPIDFLKSIKEVYCCQWRYFNYFGFQEKYCDVKPAISQDSDSQSSDSSDSEVLLKASSASSISRKELEVRNAVLEAQNAELKAQLQRKCPCEEVASLPTIKKEQ